MFKRISILPLVLLMTINFIFFYKYGSEILPYPSVFSILYIAVFISPIYFFKVFKNLRIVENLLYCAFFFLAIAYLIFLYKVPPTFIEVDRWSGIVNFWDGLFAGKFPYATKSHIGNRPGPLPFDFVIGLPFYFLREIGFLSLSSLVILVCSIRSFYKNIEERVVLLWIALSSICIYWELVARSTILMDVALISLYLTVFFRKRPQSFKAILLFGFIGGLLLCTRGLSIIPLSSILYYRRNVTIKEVALFGLAFIVGFMTFILPLALWDWKLFVQFSPFMHQAANFIPFYMILPFIVLACVASFLLRTYQQLNIAISTLIFSVITVYFIYNINKFGWQEAYYTYVDISYYIYAFPFLINAVFKNENLLLQSELISSPQPT